MHGPTCIFWANLTPFSFKNKRSRARDLLELHGWLEALGTDGLLAAGGAACYAGVAPPGCFCLRDHTGQKDL